MKEPIIHITKKSSYTKEGEPRVIVALSVDSIDTNVQKQGFSMARDKYKAHASFVKEEFEICKAIDATNCDYIVEVQFWDKHEQKVFKLVTKFSLLQGTLSVDKKCTYFEAIEALFTIFEYMDLDPYAVTYSKNFK